MRPVAEGGATLVRAAQDLAAAAGMHGAADLEPLPGGRNNRAFRLRCCGEAFLKVYFRHPSDPRDRLGAETALLAHAASLGIGCVPRVLATNRKAGLVLMEFVEGRKLAPAEVDARRVAEAADFYLALNRRWAPLSDASEACFSPAQHLACVERRVARLVHAAGQGLLRADCAEFVTGELAPAWRARKADIQARAATLPGGLDAELPRELRRVSPSDFGFHNALLTGEDVLVFLDFEYAGLDDPAKLVCDFFCQPEIPVNREHLPRFLAAAAQASPGDGLLPERVALLLSAYGIKWCCIMLNDFLALGASRRDFAGGGETEARRDRQLALARRALADYTNL